MTIHWCSTGLSATPAFRALIKDGEDVVVLNRSVDKAQTAVGDLIDHIRGFDKGALAETVKAGDVVVSMLPGDWHVPLTELALSESAHFVSSTYIAPEMRALTKAAKAAGVALLNEVG